jgi:hypothetical protein
MNPFQLAGEISAELCCRSSAISLRLGQRAENIPPRFSPSHQQRQHTIRESYPILALDFLPRIANFAG